MVKNYTITSNGIRSFISSIAPKVPTIPIIDISGGSSVQQRAKVF